MIDRVRPLLDSLGIGSDRHASVLELHHESSTTVEFDERRVAVDGRISSGTVVVETALAQGAVWLSGTDAVALNRLTGLFAFIDGDQPRLCSRFTRYVGDHASERLFPPMVAVTAAVQAAWLPRLAAWRDEEERPERILDRPPLDRRQVAVELETACSALRQGGLFASVSDDLLVAECPMPGEGPSAMEGAETSLLRVSAREEHLLLGAGLSFALELPLSFGERAAEVCSDLNAAEAAAVDGPPLLGGWCRAAGRRVCFVAFLPALLLGPGLVTTVAIWQVVRHQMTVGRLEMGFGRRHGGGS